MIKKKIPEAFESTEYRVPELKMVSPEVYELPNRKNFVNFIDEAYCTYRAKPRNKFTKSDKFTFFNHQQTCSRSPPESDTLSWTSSLSRIRCR